MTYLARHLQESFIRYCPPGWVCHTEVPVVGRDVERLLGFAPQADAMLQEISTGRRIWIEFEVSRADPVANHAKFAAAHFVAPMPPTDSFISMVSRHIVRGRSNLSAYAIGLLRTIGLRSYQTLLLPDVEGTEIKRLNHLSISCLRDEQLKTEPELRRAMSISAILGNAFDSDIHFAANGVEVVWNIHRWNADIADPSLRERWRQRKIRYFVHNSRSGLFAPSKFAAYLRLPTGPSHQNQVNRSLTGMSIESYAQIDQQHPLFDGNRAWRHLQNQLGMEARTLDELDGPTVEQFWRWAEKLKNVLKIDSAGPVILSAPLWSF